MSLEKKFWTGGPDVYRDHADETCLVVFAQMAGAMPREEIAKTAEAGRWSQVAMEPKGFVQISDDAAALAYECRAVRKDGKRHHAQVGSTYVRRDDGWKLAFHQQTEID